MAHFLMAFEDIDQDGNGEISANELRRYMAKQNYEDKFVDKFMRLFDLDNDGSITMEEYCQTLGLVPNKEVRSVHEEVYLIADGRLRATHVTVLSADMPNKLQSVVLRITREGLVDKMEDQDIAEKIKVKFDATFGRAWHVIVGTGPFGSFISNELETLFHFRMESFAVLIWKTPDY